ncbi:MAG: inositol-3-phosphate synthase [Patescibacteria group bacterium]|nr:inositol-3-phosphate synthase [Patescibacteria group bacterium]
MGRQRDKVRVGIIGVGNCASSLVQGLEYYRNAAESAFVPGLMHVNLGGYHIHDVQIVSAIDIDAEKVGKDVSAAIFSGHNNTTKFSKVPHLGVPVMRGMTHDGLGEELSKIISIAPGEAINVSKYWRETGTEVVINYLPVGSEEATKWYVAEALDAGCAFVNCIPVFIAREPYWHAKFIEKGLPVLGDDIKSQVGATILHRVLTNLFLMRGMPIVHSYQLNTGGNTDFLNMLERKRLKSKKISKTNAVVSQIENAGLKINADDIHIGPSDYVPWQKDRKLCFLRIEGRHFGDVPMDLEVRLSVEDSPNSAGIVIDAVRCAKLALNNKLSGPIDPSTYFFKSPWKQPTDEEAHRLTEAFIERCRLHR